MTNALTAPPGPRRRRAIYPRRSSQLGLLVPGRGGRSLLLGYAAGCLGALGAEVHWLEVDYGSHRAPPWRRLGRDAAAALTDVLSRGRYETVTVVGDSLGTVVMSRLFADRPELGRARGIWLAPAFRVAGVAEHLRAARHRHLVVAGERDRGAGRALVELRGRLKVQVLSIPEANGSLKVPEMALRSLEILDVVARAVRDFIEAP